MFWFYDKKNDIAEIYGSISAIVEAVGEDYQNQLYRIFSRKKLNIFKDDLYRIEKKDLITKKRNVQH